MKTTTEQDYKDRILRVLIHVQSHLDDAVSLDELAGIANFSPFHFHRVFRGMTGETVMDHVRRLRLERAAYMLKYNGVSVTRIAFAVGYETVDAFTRAFREMFGVPPTVYRKDKHSMLASKNLTQIRFHPQGDLQDFVPISTGVSEMDAQIKSLPPLRVVFIRAQGPYNQSAESAWQKICAWAGPKGLFGPKTQFIGVNYDDPDITPPDKIRYEACLTTDREILPEGDVGVQEVGNGTYAITLVKGPYTGLSDGYAALCGEWVPKKGYKLRSGPSLEFYLNDPGNTKPDDLLTEVCVPVEQA